MTCLKNAFLKKSIALLLPLTAFFLATLFHDENLSNVLSMLNAYLAGGFLLFAYIKSDRTVKVSVSLLLCSLACFSWAIADTFWAFISVLGGAPQDNEILWVIYVVPNCFFLGTLVVFAVNQFRKWDLVQTAVDITINTFLSITLFWLLFFNKDTAVLISFIKSDFTSVLSIVTDLLIGICIYSWLLSVRSGKFPLFLRIISIGLLLFTYSDIAYYYLDFNGIIYTYDLTNFTYILSMSVIAFGALWKTYYSGSLDLPALTNTGGRRRRMHLLIYPAIIILFNESGFVRFHFTIGDIISLILPIFLYWAACEYIQLSLEREKLLKRDNAILEQLVAEQVNELTFLANQDTLTTLFNRRYLVGCLEDTISKRRTNELLALLLIDMDRFKTINDTFGHDVGDSMLIDLSYRMIEWNRYGATIARLGGDEFAIMFVGKYTQEDIEGFCTEIIGCCSAPFHIGENTLSMTMSVGVAIAEEDTCNVKTMLQNADIAMYHAKSQGYNKYQVYTPILNRDFKKLADIETRFKQDATEKDFELFFQPQYALPGRELIGAETLIHWNNPRYGYIPPKEFVPIAEQIEQIFKLGRWVIQESVRQSSAWNNQYKLPLKVGFNISPKQYIDREFINFIKTAAKKRSISQLRIDAEKPESIESTDGENAGELSEILGELGITLSLDACGAGASDLGCLKKCPLDRIRIDKSTIDNLRLRNIRGTKAVMSVIEMAHASGVRTIADGVETQEQLDILIELGCDQVQGSFLGRPVPSDVFEQRYLKGVLSAAGNY